MLHKYIFLILFFLLSSFSSQSQNVPGYLGKRAFVDYNFTAPYIIYIGPKYNNFIHNLNFNYVLKRRALIGLTVDLFSLTGLPMDRVSASGEELYSKAKGSAVGVNFDWYTKRSIAPVGNYIRVQTQKFFGNYTDYTYDGSFSNFKKIEGNINTYLIGIGYGIRRIFFDKMVFNVGGSFNYVFVGDLPERGYDYTLASTYYWKMHVGVGVLLF